MSAMLCSNREWSRYVKHYNFSDSGNFILGAVRIFALLIFFLNNWRNKRLLEVKSGHTVNITVKGLVLPSYYPYVYIFFTLNFIFGMLDLILSLSHIYDSDDREEQINVWIFPIEFGLFHCLYEGLAFFLLRYGAGTKAFQGALQFGLAWGLVTAIIMFIDVCLLTNTYDLDNVDTEGAAYAVFLGYTCTLFAFYASILVIPQSMLYRRPALSFYAKFNVVYQLFWIIAASLGQYAQMDTDCACAVVALLISGIGQPVIIWFTLQRDSEYWQGHTPDTGNPLAEVWDQVDIDTAQSMCEGLTEFEQDRSAVPLPLLHFGLLNLDSNLGFVAGGFSRVYFGKLRGEKVALKVMFAMELTALDVKDFFEEAKTLHKLKHANVVSCKGLCVMPPAITIVLEYCRYGSLFDFLYKPRVRAPSGISRDRTNSSASLGGEPTVVISPINLMRLTNMMDDDNYSCGPPDGCPIPARNDRNSVTSHTRRDSGNFLATSMQSNDTNSIHSFRIDTLDPDRERARQSTGSTGSEPEYQNARPSFSATVTKVAKSAATRITTIFGGGGGTNRESMSGGAGNLLPYAQSVSVPTRCKMILDVIRAIEFLHSKGFMHCDVKSLNYLVDENYRVKLTDMGETRHVSSRPKHDKPPIAARNWAPPEVMAPAATPFSYTMKSDVFGVTIIASELITLDLPYGTMCDQYSPDQWYTKLTKDKIRPALPRSIPEDMRRVLDRGWHSDPLLRPLAAELYKVMEKCLHISSLETKDSVSVHSGSTAVSSVA